MFDRLWGGINIFNKFSKQRTIDINYTKSLKILILTNLIIVLLLLIDNSTVKIMDNNVNNIIFGINSTLGIISIISNYTYYILFKRSELLILALINAIYYITYILDSIVINYIHTPYVIDTNNLIISLLTRSILIITLAFPKSKVRKLIIANESETIVLTISLAIIFSCIELIFSGMGIGIITPKFINISQLLVIIVHIFTIISLCKQSVIKKDFISAIVAICLNSTVLVMIIDFSKDLFLGANIEVVKSIFILVSNIIPCILIIAELIYKSKREKELESNLEIFYNITENHENSAIVITDFNNNILYCNKKYKEAISSKEYSDAEFNNVSFYEYARNSLMEYDTIHNEIKQSLINNNRFKGIIKTVKDGYYDLYVQNVKDKNHEFILAVMTNVTTEYKNIEKLRVNQEKLTTINRNIKDFIVMVDKNLMVTYVNPRFLKRLGYTLHEIIGQPTIKFYDKSIKRDEIIINNKEIMTRRTLICKNQTSFEVETIETKIYDGGMQKGYIVVGRELGLINEYSALSEKYKEIQEYNKIREEFFANLSHEVRTPINVIYSSLQLLDHKRTSCDKNEFLEVFDKYEDKIKVNCLRLLRLVNNILSLTKVNTGNYQITYQTIEGISFIEEIMQSVIPFAENRGIVLMFDTNIEENYISIEPYAIEKVILNLLSNAIKFTKEGGKIIVDCYVTKEWFNITITDDGVGIPRAMRNVVFERFAQVNKSFNRESEGSGIGLALVKSLVVLHKGKVFINDTSIGTSITIKLPNKIRYNSSSNCQITSNMDEKAKIELSDIYL